MPLLLLLLLLGLEGLLSSFDPSSFPTSLLIFVPFRLPVFLFSGTEEAEMEGREGQGRARSRGLMVGRAGVLAREEEEEEEEEIVEAGEAEEVDEEKEEEEAEEVVLLSSSSIGCCCCSCALSVVGGMPSRVDGGRRPNRGSFI